MKNDKFIAYAKIEHNIFIFELVQPRKTMAINLVQIKRVVQQEKAMQLMVKGNLLIFSAKISVFKFGINIQPMSIMPTF